MPAGFPGHDNVTTPLTNPTEGSYNGGCVTFDPLSGATNSPFDARTIDYTTGTPPGWDVDDNIPIVENDPGNLSTGALSTGIGFGSPPVLSSGTFVVGNGKKTNNFTDDYSPGISKTDATAAADATYMYLGGGRSEIVNGTGPGLNGYPVGWYHSEPDPYTAGFGIAMGGNGGSRDAGAGPAYTGFPIKSVTAVGTVANGAAVEAGFTNRSGGDVTVGQSVFGSGTTATATPAMLLGDDDDDDEEEVEEDVEVDEPDDGGFVRKVTRKVKRKVAKRKATRNHK